MGVELFRTRIYERGVKRLIRLGAASSDIEAMETRLRESPDSGDIIPGSGGLRKVRFGYGRKGKSGGGRTIYYVVRNARLYLMLAYAKADQEDVPPDVLRQLRRMSQEVGDE